ncbi:integrase catalytic domain-containing protein [Trichonephila clavipes]|nr:integrase catalytic domain-containing protein [Trichonephila clavipes]
MLAALRRFIARRGHPSEIHSDNGTNFIGSKNYLKQLYMLVKEHSIQKYSTDRNIRWKSIPLCSEFGGLWESLIKWKSLLKLRQHFWDRWHKEVLHHYQSRPKWKASQFEVQVGNLVLISDDNRPPLLAHGKNTKTHTQARMEPIE